MAEAGKPIRVGVVGLGVGERHLRGYREASGCEVVAICDLDPDRLQEVGNRYDVAKRTTDYKVITEDPNIDAVSICSYDDAHAEQCLSAFRCDKHVMVEKPVALSRSETEAVLKAQQDSGRFITSNLILRQSPRFRSLKRMIESGAFGEIFCVEGDYLHDILWKITDGWRGQMPFYCTIFGGGIHLIDLMRWMLGHEVTEVGGMGNKVLTQGSSYAFDDTFLTLLRFENGTIGKCLSTFGPRRTKFHSLNVYGTKRSFVNDIPHAKLFAGDRPQDETALLNTDPAWRYPGMEKGDLIPDFVDAIHENREPIVGTRDVFRVMDICLAAHEAAETGRTISINYLL